MINGLDIFIHLVKRLTHFSLYTMNCHEMYEIYHFDLTYAIVEIMPRDLSRLDLGARHIPRREMLSQVTFAPCLMNL